MNFSCRLASEAGHFQESWHSVATNYIQIFNRQHIIISSADEDWDNDYGPRPVVVVSRVVDPYSRESWHGAVVSRGQAEAVVSRAVVQS